MSTDQRVRAALIWIITFAIGLLLPPVIQSLAKRPWLLLLAASGASVAAAVEAATDHRPAPVPTEASLVEQLRAVEVRR